MIKVETQNNPIAANKKREVNDLIACKITCNAITSLCNVKFLLNNEDITIVNICNAKQTTTNIRKLNYACTLALLMLEKIRQEHGACALAVHSCNLYVTLLQVENANQHHELPFNATFQIHTETRNPKCIHEVNYQKAKQQM